MGPGSVYGDSQQQLRTLGKLEKSILDLSSSKETRRLQNPMRVLILHRLELKQSKLHSFRCFCFIFKIFKNVKQMTHVSTFSESPRPHGTHLTDAFRNCLQAGPGFIPIGPNSTPFMPIFRFILWRVSQTSVPYLLCLVRRHHGKNGKHHLPLLSLVSHLYPIFPMVPFHDIVWEQGQKASHHLVPNIQL